MNKERFSILIKAPKEKVWDVLWNDSTYRAWTSVFSEGSYALSDWNEGSKIQFLSPDGNGMHSVIDKKITNEVMSFKHMGEMKEFKEHKKKDNAPGWEGATESYFLVEQDGHTELQVEMDVTDDFQDYFHKTFPQALGKVKELAESN